MSIRTRILLALLLLVGIGFVAQVHWVVDDLRPRNLATMEESMIDTATLLASLVSTGSAGGTIDLAPLRAAFAEAAGRRFSARVYELAKSRLDVQVYVTDARGRVLFDSDGGEDEGRDYSRWNDVIRTLRGEYGARTTLLDPGDPRSAILHVAAPVRAEGAVVGVLTVRKSVENTSLFLQEAKRRIVLSAGVAAGAILLVGGFVTAWITRPIERLTRWARELRDGRRAALPALGRSEIGTLGTAFEALHDALEGKQYVEEYVQALTHEMKAPLTSIRGAAELLEEEMSAEQRGRFLATLRTESERLRNLAERLLGLAALERRKGLRDVEAVDLAALAGEVAEAMAPAIAAKRLRVTRELLAGAMVAGEPFLLRQAVANLVQNAVEFAPAGGEVVLAVRRDGGAVELAVRDDGPGVPEYARARAFERFFSLPRPDTGVKSTGLGLTLVREIAQLHGGVAALENAPSGGARAVLRLPAARD